MEGSEAKRRRLRRGWGWTDAKPSDGRTVFAGLQIVFSLVKERFTLRRRPRHEVFELHVRMSELEAIKYIST